MNPVSNSSISKFITSMTKTDALAPIVALEATVVSGRTIQAYKRGKGDISEARERFLEEITGSIVWLWGVKVLNEAGDTIIGKILKKPDADFDVGTDKVLRTPFDNFMKKIAPKELSATQVALLKGAKVISSILIANLFIGFVVPKINHYITNTVLHNKRLKEEEQNKPLINQNTSVQNTKETSSPAFKGGIAALNKFTNAIENTNTGKLLSTDLGIAGGRAYNARKKEERREILFRDLGSIYFYMWAQGHVRNVLNYFETGSFSRLNPSSANKLTEKLLSFIGDTEMSAEEFKNAVLGKNTSEIKIPEGIKFETGNLSVFDRVMNKFKKTKTEPLQSVKVSELEKIENIKTNTDLLNRIKQMAALQPERLGESVITRAQLIDTMNDAVINEPEFLNDVFSDFTGKANKNEFKYVSETKLRNLKKQMEDYVRRLCKETKDGKINKDVLDKFNRRNTAVNGINFVAGFIFAAAFLSTFIPKLQYYMTRKTTGIDEFPGTYDYKEHHKMIA